MKKNIWDPVITIQKNHTGKSINVSMKHWLKKRGLSQREKKKNNSHTVQNPNTKTKDWHIFHDFFFLVFSPMKCPNLKRENR